MSRYDGWEEAPTRQMSKQYFDDKTFFVHLKQGRKKVNEEENQHLIQNNFFVGLRSDLSHLKNTQPPLSCFKCSIVFPLV